MGTIYLAIQLGSITVASPRFIKHSPSRSTTHTSLYTEVHTVRFARYPNMNLLIRNFSNKIKVLKSSKIKINKLKKKRKKKERRETKASNMFSFPPLFTAEFPKLSGATDPLQNITISVHPLHKII